MSSGTDNKFPEHSSSNNREEQSICSFAAIILLKYVAAMQDEINSLQNSKDIEHIHRLRVASRRIRTALGLFNACLPSKKGDQRRKQVRDVTRALGETRDTDVRIDLLKIIYRRLPEKSYRPGLRRLMLRQSQHRVKLQQKVDTTLAELNKRRTLELIAKRLNTFPVDVPESSLQSPELHNMALIAITKKLDDLLSYEVYTHQPEYKKELHEMRIAAKRLRYTLEIFAPLYQGNFESTLSIIRKVQTVLGEIHDCDVWVEFLPTFIEKENSRVQKFYGHSRSALYLTLGLQYFQQNRRRTRSRLFKQFQDDWSKWNRKNIWHLLRETIREFNIASGNSPDSSISPTQI